MPSLLSSVVQGQIDHAVRALSGGASRRFELQDFATALRRSAGAVGGSARAHRRGLLLIGPGLQVCRTADLSLGLWGLG